MLIVNQDKNHHIIYENMEDIYIENPLENDNGKFSIEAIGVSDRYVLGYYKTEVRAKEVLQEIIKTYQKVTTTINRESGQQRFYDLPKVYYMPER